MSLRLHQTTVELEVPFHDVDPLGVVWHGHYYKYFELVRTRLLGGLGLDGDELLATGYRLWVIESKCRYAFPLRYREKVRVVGWLRAVEHGLDVAYEAHNLTHARRAARAHTTLAVTDANGNLLLDTPLALLDRIAAPG